MKAVVVMLALMCVSIHATSNYSYSRGLQNAEQSAAVSAELKFATDTTLGIASCYSAKYYYYKSWACTD